ncbi:MAG TPA: flagellar basal body P-ring formation protein FlgA, partial [Xanthobacteraceae bacterium]|nr:flagellar basal body P-ring formation protein FlgA [Xanthobacteraceae bacterium]
MIRIFAITALSLATTAGIAADRLADLPRLKASVKVASDVVRIGDLIDNAGAAADIAIFRSPDIGNRGTIPASRVLDAVGPHNLLIVDTTGIRDVEVVRESRVISASDIEARIVRALSGQPGLGDPAKLSINFDRDPRTIFVEPDVVADLQVVRSVYEPRTSRFDISFSVPGSAAARAAPLRYTGSIRETVEVPVLTRQINRGDVIRDGDVMIERRARADV